MVKVGVSLTAEQCAFADRIAAEVGGSRSWVLRQGLDALANGERRFNAVLRASRCVQGELFVLGAVSDDD